MDHRQVEYFFALSGLLENSYDFIMTTLNS